MDKSNLDKLIRLYREGYISRDELILHSKKVILKKDKPTPRQRSKSKSVPPNKRPVVSAPIQAIIDLDTPPKMPDKIVLPNTVDLALWNGRARSNPILSSMFGGAFIAMAIVALLVFIVDDDDQVATNKPSTSKSESTPNTAIIPKTTSGTIAQLESIAAELEQSNHWQKSKIEKFQQLWQTLPENQQSAAKNEHWFKTLSLFLAIQLSQIHSMNTENPDNVGLKSEQENLRQLSLALGNPIADFDDPVIKKRRNIRVSEIELEPVSTPESSVNNPITTSAPVTSEPASAVPTPTISRLPELEKLLSNYVGYYENGNLDGIVKLFHGSGWHKKGQIGDFELRESYKETFGQTLQRKMLIENLNWSFKGSTALATGKLTLVYTDRENQEQHEQHGSIRLVAKLHNNEFRFSNLYHILQ